MKKGQVSIFIIIAIFIVTVIAFILILRENNSIQTNISPEIQSIYSYYKDCIKDTGEQAIYAIGWSGGYYTFPNHSTENAISYYYFQGKNYAPSKKFIESELSRFIDDMLVYCNNDLTQFSDFNIKAGEPKTTSKIEEGKVIFNVNYPLEITKVNTNYFIKNFNVNVKSRLKEIYDFSINLTNQQINNSGKVCISCINKQANDHDFYVELNDYDDETIIFTIIDKKIKIMNNDFRFNFANKYDI